MFYGPGARFFSDSGPYVPERPTMPLWRNQKVRNAALQAGYIGGLLAIILISAWTAGQNLDEQGITSGFGFLWRSTGWNLTFSSLPTNTLDPYWWYLVVGLINTLVVGLTGLMSATVVGVLVGLARLSPNKAAQLVGTIYVEIFRNVPLIVQLFFWFALARRFPGVRQASEVAGMYFTNRGIYVPGLNVADWATLVFFVVLGATAVTLIWFAAARRFRRMEPARKRTGFLAIVSLGTALAAIVLWFGHEQGVPLVTFPELAGLNLRGGFRIRTEFFALAFAICLHGGAYIGEIVRGGFNAVPKGQGEAARSLGLSSWQVFTRVRFPLALRSMLPILTNQYVWLMKATTLGIVVGFSDFFMVVTVSITQSGQTLEFIAILMGGFLAINFSLAAVLNAVNRAVALKGHQSRS